MNTRAGGRGRAIAAVAVLVALLAGGCSTDRPTSAEWRSTWDRVNADIPAESSLLGSDPADVCSVALAALRADQGALSPTPDVSLDATVQLWVEVAEATFFECPPTSGDLAGFEDAYRELARLRAEIEAGLEPTGA